MLIWILWSMVPNSKFFWEVENEWTRLIQSSKQHHKSNILDNLAFLDRMLWFVVKGKAPSARKKHCSSSLLSTCGYSKLFETGTSLWWENELQFDYDYSEWVRVYRYTKRQLLLKVSHGKRSKIKKIRLRRLYWKTLLRISENRRVDARWNANRRIICPCP